MVRLFTKAYVFYLSLLAFSAAVGVHVHTQVSFGAPQVILPWSPSNLSLDHRQLPEPEKTLLEFVLEESVNPDAPRTDVIPAVILFSLLVPIAYKLSGFIVHDCINPTTGTAAFVHPLYRRPPPSQYLA